MRKVQNVVNFTCQPTTTDNLGNCEKLIPHCTTLFSHFFRVFLETRFCVECSWAQNRSQDIGSWYVKKEKEVLVRLLAKHYEDKQQHSSGIRLICEVILNDFQKHVLLSNPLETA